MRHIGCILLFVFFVSRCPLARAGEPDKLNLTGQVSFGCTILLNGTLKKGWAQEPRFPTFKFSLAGSLGQSYTYGLASVSSAVSVYKNAVGNNLNPLVGDIQVDWVNSLELGAGQGKKIAPMLMRTVGNGSYYNLQIPMYQGVIIGSNLILNNHGRNQLVGNIIATSGPASLLYYNDGAPPFSNIGLGDNFDRWWTGGGGLFVQADRRAFNAVELTFDQFTGFAPMLYEVSTFFGIDMPQYDRETADLKGKSRNGYNTSAYNLRIGLNNFQFVEAGIRGSMRWRDTEGWEHKWGVQDLIHTGLGYSLHPNQEYHKIFIGGSLQFSNLYPGLSF